MPNIEDQCDQVSDNVVATSGHPLYESPLDLSLGLHFDDDRAIQDLEILQPDHPQLPTFRELESFFHSQGNHDVMLPLAVNRSRADVIMRLEQSAPHVFIACYLQDPSD